MAESCTSNYFPHLLTSVVILLISLSAVSCVDSDEMEVFDAVEEINQNFYTLLDIPQNADASAIKKAFRRLSLVLHPDKNDAPDAEVQFRQLVSMYDILKDPNKRRCYDNVLVNGLPDWKHAVYYYRRVRKMGLAEMAAILFVIVSIGQYLVGWAAYVERKYTVEEYISSKSKRLSRKQKKGKTDVVNLLTEEICFELEKPSAFNTLPFQIPRLIWFLLVSAPPLSYRWLRDYWEERQRLKLLEAEEKEDSDDEEPLVVQPRVPRRRKPGFSVPEVKDETTYTTSTTARAPHKPEVPASPVVVSGGLWTDDDLLELIRLVKKFPAGTSERWEKIGEAIRRPAAEVAHMAHKVKDNMVKTLATRKTAAKAAERDAADSNEEREDEGEDDEESGEGEQPIVVEEAPKKVKTRGGKHGVGGGGEGEAAANGSSASWSQLQQKAFETALAKYPKGATADRWEKIAKCVPGKTKEECMLRFKHLVDIVKKKKKELEKEQDSSESSTVLCQPEATESST